MDQAPGTKSGRSLAAAVVTALALLGIVVVCYILGRTAFFFLAVTVGLIALYEMLDVLLQRGHRPSIPFGVLCGFGLMGVAYLEKPQYYAVVVAASAFGAMLLALRPGRGPTPATDSAWTVFAVVWIGGGGAGAVSILSIGPPQDGTFLLIATFLSIALGDIAAYFIGTRFGKHKIAPSVSPNKSWEGFIGGIFGSLAGGALFAGLLFDLSLAAGLGIGAIVAVLAPAGDLVESLAKRELGVKDSGRILPGHGGFLDRLDAIIFCCPVVYLFLRTIVFS